MQAKTTLKQLGYTVDPKLEKMKDLTPIQKRILTLWKVTSIEDFTNDDLRFMLLQNVGVKHLMPKALNALRSNILIDSAYYEGDLLYAALTVEQHFWKEEPGAYETLKSLLSDNAMTIHSSLDPGIEVDRKLLAAIKTFNQLRE